MAGFIVLNDGRAYAASNWAFRATVEAIAEALPRTSEATNLAEWLRHDPSVQIYYNVDVRELAPANRELFQEAAEVAFKVQKARGPTGWSSPELWDGWINRFSEFLKMIECVRRGEPAHGFNPHMKDTVPPTGQRSGPGW
jgi:hypothetical protein